MLRSSICALMLLPAAGAKVQADISVRVSDFVKDFDDEGLDGSSSAMLDVEETAKLPESVSGTGASSDQVCQNPKVSCDIKDLILVKPAFYVIAVRRKEFLPLVGTKLVGLQTKFTGPGLASPILLDRLPERTVIRFSDIKNHFVDVRFAKEWNQTSAPQSTTNSAAIVHYRRFSTPDDFIEFWNYVDSELATSANHKIVDKIMYHALVPYIANPSFIRNVAKAPMVITGRRVSRITTFLEELVSDSEKNGSPQYPLLMDLLTDPKFYQGKKKGHKSRVLAERFRMDKEFQKERIRKAVDIRAKLKKEGERDREFDAIFDELKDQKPTVPEGTIYSDVI